MGVKIMGVISEGISHSFDTASYDWKRLIPTRSSSGDIEAQTAKHPSISHRTSGGSLKRVDSHEDQTSSQIHGASELFDTAPTLETPQPAMLKTKTQEDPWSQQRVLNVGSGLFSLFVLEALMEEIIELETKTAPCVKSSSASPMYRNATFGDFSDTKENDSTYLFRFCHYFDYICGCGDGSLVAVMLGRLRFSVREAIEHSTKVWERENSKTGGFDVTKSSRSQNSQTLHRLLHNELEEPTEGHSDKKNFRSSGLCNTCHNSDLRLQADAGLCRTMIIATHRDTIRGLLRNRTHVFRSYPLSQQTSRTHIRQKSEPVSSSLVSVCRATMAVRPELGSVRIDGISGTFQASSMSMREQNALAKEEISRAHPELGQSIELLVSVGGGSRDYQSFHRVPQEGYSYPRVEKMSDVRSGFLTLKKTEFTQMCFIGPSLNVCHDESGKHDRLAQSTAGIRKAARAYCESEQATIHEWAGKLVESRRRRALTARWETFAVGIRYQCLVCRKQGLDRTELLEHVLSEHEGHDMYASGPIRSLDKCRYIVTA